VKANPGLVAFQACGAGEPITQGYRIWGMRSVHIRLRAFSGSVLPMLALTFAALLNVGWVAFLRLGVVALPEQRELRQRTLGRRASSGSLVEKVWLFALFVSDEQPSMPAATDPAAPITDLTHLIGIAAPMPPKLRVSADFDGVHAVGD
jgi:hypothetical protein